MNELIELLFESVAAENINNSVSFLVDDREVMSSHFTGDEISRNYQGRFDYFNLLSSDRQSSNALSIQLNTLTLGSVEIREPLVQIVFHDGIFDISISFFDNHVLATKGQVTTELMFSADEFSKKFLVRNFLCGYEPAVDVETRFFTGNTLGPVPWPRGGC